MIKRNSAPDSRMSMNEAARARVALVAARVPPDIGGIETHVAEVAPRLHEQGFDLTVLATDRSRVPPTDQTIAGVPLQRFPAHPRGRDWYFAPALFRHLLRTQYDLVHIQGANTTVPFLASLASLITRTPFVVTFHSGGALTQLRQRLRGLQFRLLGCLVRHAAALIAVSEFEADVIRDATGWPSNLIEVVRNGGLEQGEKAERTAWPLDCPPDEQDVLLVSVGRLEKYKGHHRAIAAMPAILRRIANARLLVLGKGPEDTALRILVSQLGLDKSVSVRYIPPDERHGLTAILERADLLLLLSDYEAHPVAVMEAVALGTKTLVSLNSGMTELVALGWSSGVRPDASADEIASAVVEAIESGPIPATDDLPTWESCANRLGEIYAEVLGHDRPSGVQPRRHGTARSTNHQQLGRTS